MGEEAVVAVPFEVGGGAEGVDLGDDLAGVVDHEAAGVALARCRGRHAVTGCRVPFAVGEAEAHVAVRAALGDAAVPVVVLVRVAAVVRVRPGRDAAGFVVREAEGRPEALTTSVRLPSV